MNPKRIVIVSTIALAISLGSLLQHDDAFAQTASPDQSCTKMAPQDQLHHTLGLATNEQLYDALYEGQSLAEIAQQNHKDVQRVIDLQVAQLSEQLDARLMRGVISLEQYEAHQQELVELITNSVYGQKGQ